MKFNKTLIKQLSLKSKEKTSILWEFMLEEVNLEKVILKSICNHEVREVSISAKPISRQQWIISGQNLAKKLFS